MTNHASRAARDINEMIRTAQHTEYQVAPDFQGSTEFLESLSADLLREKLRRRPLVEHPDRHSHTFQVLVRSIFPDRDRSTNGPSLLGAPSGPGRETFGGEAA
jgi:hypothetical protein